MAVEVKDLLLIPQWDNLKSKVVTAEKAAPHVEYVWGRTGKNSLLMHHQSWTRVFDTYQSH